MLKTLTKHFLRKISKAAGILLLLALVSSQWNLQTAMAAAIPLLDLKLTGPQTTPAGQPLVGINVSLINSGPASQDARLRLFIILDRANRGMQAGDVKVDVQEGALWVPLPLELIDDAVMGAIGVMGKGHKALHQRGGFAIPANLNKLWPLRITFRLPGMYSLEAAVSPDNGDTHLAQPASITIEAL